MKGVFAPRVIACGHFAEIPSSKKLSAKAERTQVSFGAKLADGGMNERAGESDVEARRTSQFK